MPRRGYWVWGIDFDKKKKKWLKLYTKKGQLCTYIYM